MASRMKFRETDLIRHNRERRRTRRLQYGVGDDEAREQAYELTEGQ